MISEYKHVHFELYCNKCKYFDLEESEEPCNECLQEAVNLYSHKPVKYEAKDTGGKT